MLIRRIGRQLLHTKHLKKYQQQLIKANPKGLQSYPKTFEEKMMVLNDPKTIQLIEVVEFGAKYKPGNRLLPVILLAIGAFCALHEKILPIRVIDRLFMISPQSPQYKSGYLFAGFVYEKPFYLYAPLVLGLYQLSRFVTLARMVPLVLTNFVVGSVYGQYLVNKRVSKYEVWENQRICYGEGTLLSMAFSFWSALGFKHGITNLKSKIFLKTIPGIGIVRAGIPIAFFCLLYSGVEIFYNWREAKNTELVLANCLAGILYGLIIRRYFPIIK